MKLTVKTFNWTCFEDDDDDPEQGYHIEAYGHNQQSEPCLLRIQDFTPYMYCELPDKEWSKSEVSAIEECLRRRLGNHAPIKCIPTRRKRLFYYRAGKTYPLLLLAFKTEGALRHCSNLLKRPIEPVGLPRLQLIPREADVGQVKKLCAMRKIPYVGWLQVAHAQELPIGHEDRISSDNGFTHEYIISWKDINPVPEVECSLWNVNPTVLSWDIEVLSYNPKIFPSPMRVRDEVFMIGVTFKRLNHPSTLRHIILVYGPHDDLPNTEVRRYKSELAVIFAFCDLINELNPDILLTYNGLQFDFNYLNRRLVNVLENWKPCGRVAGRKPKLVELKWQSGAYGIQELVFLAIDGRMSIDMLPIIKRDFKLDQYTLDFCSHYFLKKNKAPVTPSDIFRYYKIAQEYSFPEIAEAAKGKTIFPFLTEFRLHTPAAVQEVVEAYEQHCGTEAVVEAVLDVYRKYKSVLLAIIGHYCVIDTLRPLELMEHLNSWIGLNELAQIVKVPIMDTFTRGQQIRVFSQLYDLVNDQGYYIDGGAGNQNQEFVGGYVHHPTPGLYKDVLSFDFASLYPSIIQAYNISMDTYVPAGVQVPDEMCNIVEWEETGGEEAVDPSASGEDEAGAEAAGASADGAQKLTQKKTHRHRFIKSEIKRGVFSELLDGLLMKRKATRKIMEREKKGSSNWNILNARQNALKVSANSCYGFLGVRKSKMPFLIGAVCVTAMGRLNIHKIMTAVTAEGGQQVYGDSVASDTPIPIRVNGLLRYRRISDLYDFDTEFGSDSLEKQEVVLREVDVWSDRGWTPIKRVIRHKVAKKMYRVLTHTGVVDVTEDHSLLSPDGTKIRPRDVAVGTKLLHHSLPITEDEGVGYLYEGRECLLTEDEAYLWGMFYAEGSCGDYDCPSGRKRSWAISNQDHQFLDKTRLCAKRTEGGRCTFKISNADKLVTCGDVKYLVEKYRKLFYTGASENSLKIVPDCVLSAKRAIKQAFLQGYYDGDGAKTCIRMDNKDKIGAASLFHLCTSLGWSVSINDRASQPEIYRLNGTMLSPPPGQRKCPMTIKKILELPRKDQWVYDLETENHHFAAGIGSMIVHNTDSAFIRFMGIPRDKMHEFGKAMAKKLSASLPPPMKLEFENAFASLFCASAKRYAAVMLKEDGTPETDEEKLYKRGIILARRDNCILLREMYKAILLCIVYERGYEEAIEQLMYYTTLLMGASVPLAKLIIIKTIAASYKSESNCMAVFGRRLKALGKNTQGGDRLEYVFVESEETLQGYKMALPEMVQEEPEKYRVDRAYYFEKCIIKPIQQLLEIGFNFKKDYMKNLLRSIQSKQAMCRQIDEMGRQARKIRIVIRR